MEKVVSRPVKLVVETLSPVDSSDILLRVYDLKTCCLEFWIEPVHLGQKVEHCPEIRVAGPRVREDFKRADPESDSHPHVMYGRSSRPDGRNPASLTGDLQCSEENASLPFLT